MVEIVSCQLEIVLNPKGNSSFWTGNQIPVVILDLPTWLPDNTAKTLILESYRITSSLALSMP